MSDNNKKWHSELTCQTVIKNLEKNHFQAKYAANTEEAAKIILDLIPDNSSVGLGGSMTFQEIPIWEELKKKTDNIINHGDPSLTPEEKAECRLKEQTCDVFLTSSNALTMDGKLVNMDGLGNRVSAMIYGPKKVIIAVGKNKIVKNLEQAIDRIERIASPINNKRLNRPNPCTETGYCVNCSKDTRICNVLTVMHKKPSVTDITIILINEDLGY